MLHSWSYYANVLTSIIVIVNPVGAIPVFVSLTESQSEDFRHHTAFVCGCAVAIILIVSVFAGLPILHGFGISLPAFKVAGGILILFMAIAMMHAKHGDTRHTEDEAEEAADKESIGVVPLAMPLLAGPGAISTVIVFSHEMTKLVDKLMLTGFCIIVGLAVWIVLRLADPIAKLLGRTGINIVTRLMGLFLTAIAVEFIIGGLKGLLPILGGG